MIHPTVKVSEEVNRKWSARTQWFNFQPHTSTVSATMHSFTDRWQCHAKSRSYCMQDQLTEAW